MSKVKKPKMGNVVAAGDPQELVTVRHSATGLYLVTYHALVRINASSVGGDAYPIDLGFSWCEREDASILTRARAILVCDTYLALTGDLGVELEPVVEEVL